MMREHFGEGGDSVPLLAPRARFSGAARGKANCVTS